MGAPAKCKHCGKQRIPEVNVAYVVREEHLSGKKCLRLCELKTSPYVLWPKTHLQDLKEPSTNMEWQWSGCNRGKGSCRGVGVLWCNTASWTRLEGPFKEHMWLSGNLFDMPVIVGVVYVNVAQDKNMDNCQIIQCDPLGCGQTVLLVGDFNTAP